MSDDYSHESQQTETSMFARLYESAVEGCRVITSAILETARDDMHEDEKET
jgi:hypothetical protein